MKWESFQKEVFDYAAKKGVKSFELFSQQDHEFEVFVSQQELERYKDALSSGCSFKALKDGKAGYSYTEVYDSQSAREMVDDAVENLSLIDSTDPDFIYEDKPDYGAIPEYDDAFGRIPADEKIDWAMTMEKSAMDTDPRIRMVPYCLFTHLRSESRIANSHGLDARFSRGGGIMYANVLASDGTSNKNDKAYRIDSSPENIHPAEIGRQAAENALKHLGAKSIKGGKYPVILRGDVLTDLLQLFFEMVNAEQVQKGFSLLKDKLGSSVFSKLISVIEDPQYSGSPFNASFDSQGVPTTPKRIVDHGSLTTYLHSLKTAKKDGVAPTGNAFRGSYRGKERIRPCNAIVEPGNCSFESMIEQIGSGLLITDVQGMHSGANPVSGDFSVSAEGFLIDSGKIGSPVEQITVSANLLEMLNNVECLSDTLRMGLTFEMGMWAPDLWVRAMDISGSSA